MTFGKKLKISSGIQITKFYNMVFKKINQQKTRMGEMWTLMTQVAKQVAAEGTS